MKNTINVLIASLFISGLLIGCSEPQVDCSKTTLTAAQREKSCKKYDAHKKFWGAGEPVDRSKDEVYTFDDLPGGINDPAKKKGKKHE